VPFAVVHESVVVQVFGRRHDEPFHALWRPASEMRIPEKATTLSGAWRPRDPVDDDQDGARA
jgi:hypothetical protein